MVPLRRLLMLLTLWLTMGSGRVFADPLPAVSITGDPIALSPTQPGTGLCTTSRISTDPSADFSTDPVMFASRMNAFLDASPDASNPNARVTSVLRTLFDLSNNNPSSLKISNGDYENAVPGCQTGGCGFIVNDTNTSFATRLRGYLNVTSDLVMRPVHFGFYADDAVALTLYGSQSRVYAVINRPPKLGAPTWRTTNSVTFEKPGLYAVEVLYAQIAEHAALEMSVWVGAFSDFERPANQTPIVRLKDAGFSLLPSSSFYQSETGQPSFADPGQCEQCDRQYASLPGNNGCDPGYHCNGAALCDACDTSAFCGSSCARCSARTPFCVAQARDRVCVECRQHADCMPPSECQVGACDVAGTCSFQTVMDGMACQGGTCRSGLCVSSGPSSSDGGTPGGGGDRDGGGGWDGGMGAPGGAGPGPDGGAMGGVDGGAEGGVDHPGTPSTGCGCGTRAPPLLPASLLAFACLVRRMRRKHSG